MAMIAAGFSGGEAEELRRAFGFKRSEVRMKEVEIKLRRGMEGKEITGTTQDRIIRAITSFALYGFPESHAASFALLAYASAYLKCHYLAAFTAAMLNNQPMGFYQPVTLMKDAQRHGLKFKPIDVTRSQFACTLEESPGGLVVRVGLRYVKTLRKETALQIIEQRNASSFVSIEDLKQRVPQIQKDELRALASVGALNFISGQAQIHRRTALWQVESASRPSGPLFKASKKVAGGAADSNLLSPLDPMDRTERLRADLHGTGLTFEQHPMAHHRTLLNRHGVVPALRLAALADGTFVFVAGSVIVRQRPGTAKGFVFLSLEDETGIANIIIAPPLFEKEHVMIVHQSFLMIAGILQNQDGVVSVKAVRIEPLSHLHAEILSHDFH
jgi:error-prone DNA polymerase